MNNELLNCPVDRNTLIRDKVGDLWYCYFVSVGVEMLFEKSVFKRRVFSAPEKVSVVVCMFFLSKLPEVFSGI